MPTWKDSRKSRLIFVGTLMGSAGLVALITLWLTVPRFWPIARETSIERAVKTGTGPAFWWPTNWRDEYDRRRPRFVYSIFQAEAVQSRFGTIRKGNYQVQWPELGSLVLVSPSSEVKTAEDRSRLAVIRNAPDFVLTDQSAKIVRMSELRGTVLLVSFIFTTCNGSCPATTHRMGLVQQELKSRGLLKDGRVRLFSITLDPTRDTPEVLARYVRLFDADPEHWSFLTGPVEDVQKTIAAWDMWVRPAANGQLDHPSRIFLVDQKGKVREIYNLSFLKPAWAADDVKLLLDESAPTTGNQ